MNLRIVVFLLSTVCFCQVGIQTYKAIEEIHSRAAKSGNSTEDLGKLYDNIANMPHSYPLSSVGASSMKPFFVSAEKKYRTDGSDGIKTATFVKSWNDLATSLGLPRHALLTESQVAVSRNGDLFKFPQFMGYRLFTTGPDGKEKENDVLSPFQALFLFMGLMDSKTMLSAFAQTPEEWEKWDSDRKKGLNLRPSYMNDDENKQRVKENGTYARIGTITTRNEETQIALNKALSNLSEADALKLAYKVMTDLGIM